MKVVFALIPLVLLVGAELVQAAPLKVLTYSSLLGKDSFGEFLEKEFPKFCAGCEVKFKSTDEISGLLGKLRAEKRKKTAHSFDAVLGLDSQYQSMALKEGLVKEGQAFDRSPFALIVDIERLPEKIGLAHGVSSKQNLEKVF